MKAALFVPCYVDAFFPEVAIFRQWYVKRRLMQ